MGQNSYTINTNPFSAGTIGFTNDYTAFSYANPNSALFGGLAVVQLTPDFQCDLPSSGNTKFIGAVIWDVNYPSATLPTNPNSNFQTPSNYPVNSLVPVMSRGQLQVYCYSAVTTSSEVWVINAIRDQQQTLVFSADIIVGNSIAGTVNNVALTATPFNVTNAGTLTDLAAKIAAVAGVLSAVSDGVHTITVTADDDTVVTLTGFLVTGGASQATAVITQTVAAVFSTNIGMFAGASVASASFQVASGARWVASSGLDQQGNLVAMLDINIPGVAT